MKLQVDLLKKDIDKLQKKYGHQDFTALYGTGCIAKLNVFFLFMNPTARNLTVRKEWNGIRAPWVGMKSTWKLLNVLGFIDDVVHERIRMMKSDEWTNDFVTELYSLLAKEKIYLTNLARCTQPDAQHVPDVVFQESRSVTLQEIALVQPKIVISFGNQVSSNLLQRPICVSQWRRKKIDLPIGKAIFPVYPVYYPVGMGLRNMHKAIADIKRILKTL